MQQEYTGHVIVVMGPTGSGKGTMMSYAHTVYPQLHETVSCTTREPRPGEVDGVNYWFLSADEFSRRVDAGDFIEWAWFGSNRYGTLKSEIIPRLQAGELVLTEIEVQGVEQLRRILPATVMTVVYIEAGNWDTLVARAKARAPITDDELEKRYERYKIEVQAKSLADIVIENTTDDFTPAQEKFAAIVGDIQRAVTTVDKL